MDDRIKALFDKHYEGAKYHIQLTFPVLHYAWECDSMGYIAIVQNGADLDKKLILTDHGAPYFADPEELSERISYYQEVLGATACAQKFLEE